MEGYTGYILLVLLLAAALGAGLLVRKSRSDKVAPDQQASVQTDAQPWHSLDVDQVLAMLETGKDGLSSEEAQLRLQKYGPNRLPEAKPRSPLVRFLSQFHNVLIYVLLGAGIVTTLLQHWLDAAVIFGVVVVNALIGYIQEGKAEDALAAIRQMMSPKTMVMRAARRMMLPAGDLVPGDIVPLQAGDKVDADLRLIQVNGLRIEEAALTGESVPVEKRSKPVSAQTVLADRDSMAYSGTLVTNGQGVGVVTATGVNTEIGRISALVAGVQPLTTPLLRQMAQFGRWLTLAIIVLASLSFAYGVFVHGYTMVEMFMASVGLAVAAIPEGLPAIMTITLAIGVQRMAGKQAIIRRLPAVETLGTVSVICSDKTGTLTRNEMTVRAIALADRAVEVTGIGYETHGGFLLDGNDYAVGDDPLVLRALHAANLCNDASVSRVDGQWSIEGDPMEAALTVAAIKGGLEPDEEARLFPRNDLIPFDTAHKFMATLHHSHDGETFIFLKGAPEQVIGRCALEQAGDGDRPADRAAWDARIESLASKGYRVLAVAMKRLDRQQSELGFPDVESDMVMLGLFGLIDPPRPEAIEAVALCHQAGIGVKMITGDHRLTASAIAGQIGLANPGEALTGVELDEMSDEELLRRVEQVDVYARVTPEHKLRLVTLLQERGRVAAMTGDGVNDAPALKRADVGIAMGNKGTEVAKDASEMVLADDNFASIVNAVKEGRTVYDNLKKAILFILPTNGGEALVILGAVVMGMHQFPLTPVQILWVNMITAVTLALALAFEPPEPGLMRRPPRNPREPVLSGLFLWRILFVAVILMLGTFGLFQWDIRQGESVEHARTVAVNTLVAFEIFYLFSSRYITAPVLNREGMLGNRYVLVAVAVLVVFQMIFTYAGPVQHLFGTEALAPEIWLRILLVGSTVLWLVELEKFLMRRRNHGGGSPALGSAVRNSLKESE